MRLGIVLPVLPLLLGALAARPAPAEALVWPDVADRVERGLAASDPAARRAAARELTTLGPARATPLVLKALDDTDPEVRAAAAQSAIRLRVAEAIDRVLPWLGERDARLKLVACEVLRALPAPRAVPALARTLGDADVAVRSAAAEALGAQGAPEAAPPLLGKLDDPSPAVRVQVARALARLGDGRAVVPLVGKVQDSVPEVRQAVARALGDLADPRASQALVLQLRDNVVDVRIEALSALGRMRAQDSVDAIAPLLADRAPNLRHAALAALGRIGSPAAVRALVSAIGVAEDGSGSLEATPVRLALVQAKDAAVTELVALLERREGVVVGTSAAWVLAELGQKRAAPAIVSALRRGALPPAAAMRALSGCGGGEHVPVVLEFLGDPSQLTRAEATRAAERLLDPASPDGRAVEPLLATLKNPRLSSAERVAVVGLLGRTGAPRAAAALADLAKAKDGSLRLAALDALATLGPAGADDAMLEALDDADPVVRVRASRALARGGGAKARDELLARLGKNDEIDRFAHLAALAGVVSREPSADAVRRLSAMYELSVGAERMAVLEALGRARTPSALGALERVARSDRAPERRAAAALLASHAPAPEAAVALERLLADPDPDVQRDAAYALAAAGLERSIPALEAALGRDKQGDLAPNLALALGRIAGRLGKKDVAARALCPVLDDPRAYVRADALAGLALAQARCGDGAKERKAVTEDANELVRSAAARALHATRTPADARTLDQCAAQDRSGAVAALCRGGPAARAAKSQAVTVFVVPDGSQGPRAFAPAAILYADGMVRLARTDARGAITDPAAPDGDVQLVPFAR